MNANKRLFLLLSLFLLAFSLLSACEDTDDDADDDDIADDDDSTDDDDDTTDDDDDDSTDDDDDDDDDNDDDVVIDLTWSIEEVDASSNSGQYTSIALDSLNQVHISYYDVDASALKYVNNVAKTWNVETVDNCAEVGKYSSLGISSGGFAHISYFDETNGDLKYATNKSGSWSVTSVKTGAGLYTSLVLDPSDWAHISHVSTDNMYLYYSENTAAGTWSTGQVDFQSGDWSITSSSSIALDSEQNAHIAYNTASSGATYMNQLKYANNVSKAWNIQVAAEDTETEITYGTLALDPNGKVHMAYYYHGWGEYYAALKYATNKSGTWVNEAVEWSEFVGQYNCIQVDDSGFPHISYFDLYNSGVKYATKQSSNWHTEMVDSEGSVGEYTSLAIEDTSHVHISYYDMENDRLKYAASSPAK